METEAEKHQIDNIIHVDGGLSNMIKPPLGRGYAKVNLSPTDRTEIYLDGNNNTSIEAELFAILSGITFAIKHNKQKIQTDSQWCYKAITFQYRIKEPRLKLMVSAIGSLLRQHQIELSWAPRELNWAT
jgi:ribonuclease HI